MKLSIYYTTVTRKQINILYMHSSLKNPSKENVINISKDRIDYLYKIADCGGGYAYDKQEEEFRKRISESVGMVLQNNIREAEKILNNAFDLLTITKTGKYVSELEQKNK